MIDGMYGAAVNHFRAQLDLPRASTRTLRRRRSDARWPILYGYSPAVLPRPSDWRPGIDVVGYWWPAHPTGWQPPTELVEFLDAGPPPVVIGFGSTVNSSAEAERLSTVVAQAVRDAGVRAVIQAGWAGLDLCRDDVIAVGEVPTTGCSRGRQPWSTTAAPGPSRRDFAPECRQSRPRARMATNRSGRDDCSISASAPADPATSTRRRQPRWCDTRCVFRQPLPRPSDEDGDSTRR